MAEENPRVIAPQFLVNPYGLLREVEMNAVNRAEVKRLCAELTAKHLHNFDGVRWLLEQVDYTADQEATGVYFSGIYCPAFDMPTWLFSKYCDLFTDYPDCFLDLNAQEMQTMLCFWAVMEAECAA